MSSRGVREWASAPAQRTARRGAGAPRGAPRGARSGARSFAVAFAFALAPVLAGAARAQGDWTLCGGAAAARVVAAGGAATVLQGPRATQRALPAGDCAVHFGHDALGKPASLAFVVPDGADVQLAIDPAAASPAEDVPLAGPDWRESAGARTVRTRGGGAADASDYRVEAIVAPAAATTAVGLVARWRDSTENYTLLLDLAAREVRLERQLGPEPFVLARAALRAPPVADAPRRLALQVHGFRLQALLDDEVVLQLLDGALTKGAFGVCWQGAPPVWRSLAIAPPAAPRASVALVQGARGAAALHAALPSTPGHWFVLELRLDRPHALLPFDAAGLEPWLSTRPAAPRVLTTDLRGALGARTFGELPANGFVSLPVEWPDLPALRLQVAMARLLLVTPDGDRVTAASPAVPLRL